MSVRTPLRQLVLVAAVLFAVAAVATGGAAPVVPPLAVRLHRAFSVSLDGGQRLDAEDGGGGLMECLGALAELRACTSEILIFFVNGESYIGPECCRAIRGATRHCWPAMLATVGFTSEEADVLRGFCEAEAGGGGQSPAPPTPAPGTKA
ncbi:hypothetical protein ACP70R_020011 [Stipagrostis hirtigluma subsp. patula]